MKKKCKGCEHFHIRMMPNMPWDTGLVECDKHYLVCDITSMQHVNGLECVEGGWEKTMNDCAETKNVDGETRLDRLIADMAYILDSLTAYRRIAGMPDCNTCGRRKNCEWMPSAGEMVRINCPFHEDSKKQ